DENRKKRTGKIKFLDYLFQFLDAFDFGEIKTDEVSGSLKTHSDLISSAVLGQVFEKLNGYKDGSFYTPSFITEYMSKQSIDNLVLQRFSQKLDGYFDNIADLAEEIQLQIRQSADKQAKLNEFNAEIDHLKICDPAVGSGYFLVSVLNYLIALKSQLGILTDENGRRLNANIAYEFDELVIKNTDDSRFHYTRPQSENEYQHIIQKTLFKQKEHIIENCLFGVDINPNSCEIARLRLWIELLKSAYFTDFEEQNPLKQNALETLPNIDINIKCGNSLVSYFAVNEDIKISDKKAVEQLKEAVKAYKTGNDNKEILLKQIKGLQDKFRNIAWRSNKEIKRLVQQCQTYEQSYGNFLVCEDEKLKGYFRQQGFDFVEDFNEQDAQKDFNQLLKLHDEIFNLDQFNPFEWRFEFPEVLDEDGNFTGFDLMIANPPYIRQEEIKEYKPIFSEKYQVFNSTADIYTYFFELGYGLLKSGGTLSFITSNKFCRASYGKKLRQFILDNSQIAQIIDLNGLKVFDSATVDTQITTLTKCTANAEHS
ncbi:MAG: class I SAM-dependent DNA methyltransferase, partial [Neisseriaceae bacterium]|nr:class I SAM-dependent DNA methyltransferase [Neisseriaceae bacterium]